MRKSIIGGALLGILMVILAVPGAALAGGGKKGCSNIGTWFGISPVPPGEPAPYPLDPPSSWPDTYLAGWSVTVAGKSNNEGTNHFEYPNFDATLGMFSPPVRIDSMRGNWKRTGGNTFAYTFMGIAFNDENEPVYIAKISGEVELIQECQYQKTTAVMEVFDPLKNPFDDEVEPLGTQSLGEFYGYRAKVVPPPSVVTD